MTRGVSTDLPIHSNCDYQHSLTKGVQVKTFNLTQDDDGDSLLHLCTYSKNDETCSKLIRIISRTSLNLQNNLGQTALHTAAILQRVNVVKELINHGIEQAYVDSNGNTAFHLACSMNNIDLVKSLSGKHFNKSLLQMRNFFGETVLHSALRSKTRREILLYLITELETNVNMTDSRSGRNVFHILAEEGDLTLFQILLNSSKCPDLSLLTFSGHSIYQLAIGWDNEELANFLTKLGADDEPYQSTDDNWSEPEDISSDNSLNNFINMSLK